nr:helitron helicase-like domain-containing protein [Tanacetum cinerariifolium]
MVGTIERLKNDAYKRRPEYHLCCGERRIYMQPTSQPPDLIKELLTNKHFMENIQAYNQMFVMASFGAKIDDSVNRGRGPYVFKVSSYIYHWIGSLCPEEGRQPCFLQLYIYDTEYEVSNNMQHFEGTDGGTLDPEIVQRLTYIRDEHNELVRLFRTVQDKCRDANVPDFKIRLYNMGGIKKNTSLNPEQHQASPGRSPNEAAMNFLVAVWVVNIEVVGCRSGGVGVEGLQGSGVMKVARKQGRG